MSNDIHTLLVFPRLKIQNANAISSPLTWGFPAMSAFIGLMQALDRKANQAGIAIDFESVGVVCHDHEAQVTEGGYNKAFRLTRNPVDKSGGTAAIVEEGRTHLELSLIFSVRPVESISDETLNQLTDILNSLRVAGGSVLPTTGKGRRFQSHCQKMPDDEQSKDELFRRLKRSLLPGFALVLRDDLLAAHADALKQAGSTSSVLDAWLDLSRVNVECRQEDEEVIWDVRRKPGWLVPIPVGYSAISELYDAGAVSNARDSSVPFRFVESLFSIGQWVSPHRLKQPQDLLWYIDNDIEQGIYRLNNDYQHQIKRESALENEND